MFKIQKIPFLTPPQQEISSMGLLSSGFSCVLQMPTGSGKTWLAEQAIENVLSTGQRAIYLTPLRALGSELFIRWTSIFKGFSIGIFTGDYGSTANPYPIPFKDAQLLIMTPERLDACLRNWRSHWGWIPDVDLVVIDELHLLGEGLRGARLEGTISRFRKLNPFSRFLGLSATLGNRNELADWLDGIEYVSNWRPIPLQWRIARYRKAEEKTTILLEEVSPVTNSGGKSLIFVHSRRRAENLSNLLKSAGISAAHHHAGLSHIDRSDIEHQFRTTGIDALVATSTLEVGLNLPVKQVVLYDLQQFDGVDFRPLKTINVWQRAGRAGRYGLDTVGECVLIAPSWDRVATTYSKGVFEPVLSQLTSNATFSEQILVELSSGLSRTRTELRDAFSETLSSHQKRLPDIDHSITTMIASGMLQEDNRTEEDEREVRLRPTRLGRVAVRHMLNPTTVTKIREILESIHEPTYFDLLLAICSTEDCEPIISCDFEELDQISAFISKQPSYLLERSNVVLLNLLGCSSKRVLASLKMAAIARDWSNSGNIELIADSFNCYPYEVTRLTESLSRLLHATADLLQALQPNESEESPVAMVLKNPTIQKTKSLAAMVEHGINENVASMLLVKGIGPKWAQTLASTGIEDIEDLAQSDPIFLAKLRGLSEARATLWVTQAEEVIKSEDIYIHRDFGPKTNHDNVHSSWPQDIDPYRFRRSWSLTVEARGDAYLVTGGLDPHQVYIANSILNCDCKDFSNGHQCKHILAVRLHTQDPLLLSLVKQLDLNNTNCSINLQQFWFEK